MPVTRGINNIDSEKGDDGNEEFRMYLNLKSGESARIRFITDGTDVVGAYYHSVRIPGKVSKAGKPVFVQKYCYTRNEGEDCEYCSKLDSNDSTIRKLMSLYVWVYEHHRSNGEMIVVDAPRVIRIGRGNNRYISNMFSQFYRKYTTLCDRDYEWRRQGDGKEDTVYSLLPEDKGPAPKDMALIARGLPELGDVAKGVVEWPEHLLPKKTDGYMGKEQPFSIGTGNDPAGTTTVREGENTSRNTSSPTPPRTAGGGKSLLQMLREREEAKNASPETEDIGEEL